MRTGWFLAWRSLWDRPRRALLLLVGYGIGVAVMIALLSVGEALLAQARDRDLVGGGDLVLLPEGIDPDVLKVNGVTDLNFTIQQAGFVTREILHGLRFGPAIMAAAPEIDARQVYIRVRGRTFPATATAGIPSLDEAARATGRVPGARDTAADRAWTAPSPQELIDRLDRFHAPPPGVRQTWAEWDYFNFADPESGAYGYLTIFAGGEGWGGVLLRIKRPGLAVEDVAIRAGIQRGDLSFDSANQRIGPARVQNVHGRYHVTVEDRGVQADLWLTPEGGAYLPAGESVGDAVISGYVVPVIRGWMSGRIHTMRTSLRLADAPAYHDHNWGTWRGVTWEWGEASGSGGAVLYGSVHVEGSQHTPGGRAPVLFAWSGSRDGTARPGRFLGVFTVQGIHYAGWHPGPLVGGQRVMVPTAVTVEASSGADSVRVHIRVLDALASTAGQGGPVGSSPGGRGSRAKTAFLQLRGVSDIRGSVDGRPFAFSGHATAETFVPLQARTAPGQTVP
jgi:hypothetical protein